MDVNSVKIHSQQNNYIEKTEVPRLYYTENGNGTRERVGMRGQGSAGSGEVCCIQFSLLKHSFVLPSASAEVTSEA